MATVKEKKASQRASGKPSEGKVSKRGVSKNRVRADSIVTARVPVEIKEQGDAILKKIGATPTELVNATYQYVIEHGELPKANPSLDEVAERRRSLTPEQKADLKARIDRITLKAPATWAGKTFEELREEAMRERYPEYFF